MIRILFICLLMLGINAKAQKGYQIGDIASEFSLKSTDEKNVSLSNYPNAKGYIVVFTCNTCPVSKAYQGRIEYLNKEFASKGYPVIAINTNDPETSPGDSYENMQKLAREKNFSYAYLEDPNHFYTKMYGATKTPHTFVLQKTAKGNQVAYIGAIDQSQDLFSSEANVDFVKNAVNSLLKGEKPKVATMKAFGCSIKWKKEGTSK